VDDEARIAEFKKEFKALMQKYGADMWPACEGDTHGIYDEVIECELVGPTRTEAGHKRRSRTFLLYSEGEQV